MILSRHAVSLLLRSTRSLVDPIILPLKSSSSRLVSSSSYRRHPHNYLLPPSYRHPTAIGTTSPTAILSPPLQSSAPPPSQSSPAILPPLARHLLPPSSRHPCNHVLRHPYNHLLRHLQCSMRAIPNFRWFNPCGHSPRHHSNLRCLVLTP
jgi:hypothetical protein